MDVIKSLHVIEKKVLISLKNSPLEVSGISKSSGLDSDQVRRACEWLKEKALVQEASKEANDVKLAKSGEEYFIKGLPERRFIKALEQLKGKASVDDISKVSGLDKNEINYSLGFCRKQGFIGVSENKFVLTSIGREWLSKKYDAEEALQNKKQNSELQKRGIIEIIPRTSRTYSLSEKAQSVIDEIEVTDDIGIITQATIRAKPWQSKSFRPFNLDVVVPKAQAGRIHYLRQALDYVRDFWLSLGFKEMKGPLLESSFWNFDALFQPQDHPAREMQDTFYMKTPAKSKLPDNTVVNAVKTAHEKGVCGSKGWRYKWSPEIAAKNIMRTHSTVVSARTLASLKKKELPVKYFSVGRVFRNETLDWKHTAEFYQTDGIVIDENVSFRDLIGYLRTFFTKMGFPKARFRPGYFPYTEMSLEIEVYHPEHKQWMELGGAGMFRPEVVFPLLGIDIPVLAWGPGLERTIMSHYKISDIRKLYGNDLSLIRGTKTWMV